MKNFLLLILTFLIMSKNFAQYQPLYANIPNSIKTPNVESESDTVGILIVEKVSIPSYQYFRVANDNIKRPCVIICPGGGYSILAAGHEGVEVAKYFNSIGVNALVLKYRIPNSANQIDKSIAPLQDVQQAILLARTNAAQWGIAVNKIGIMGFSAGGHLASTAATHWDEGDSQTKITVERQSSRPDFAILIYPVITLDGPHAHQGSRQNLLGKSPTAELVRRFCNDQQVNAKTPPTFLAHALDDKPVPPENSRLFYTALQKHQDCFLWCF